METQRNATHLQSMTPDQFWDEVDKMKSPLRLKITFNCQEDLIHQGTYSRVFREGSALLLRSVGGVCSIQTGAVTRVIMVTSATLKAK